jgi:hypothetical protein
MPKLTAKQRDDKATCAECGGETIAFKGIGLNAQYWICPQYAEPGHLSEDEVKVRLAEFRTTVGPSGRFA